MADDVRFLNNLVQQLELLRFDHSVLPLKRSIDEYVRTGIPRGDFLTALLAGDYKRAIAHADTTNRWLLPIYVGYIEDAVPSEMRDSYEKVAAHITSKREGRANGAVARHGGGDPAAAPTLSTRTPKP